MSAEYVSVNEAIELREEVREIFSFAFDSYMRFAFPHDELKPKSCKGEDSLGSYALTLVDALDTLALMGNRSAFAKAVTWIGSNINFENNKTVSLFETNIRVMGGLLSAHLLASDPATGMRVPGYANELLTLAEDLGRRLLPAFDTPTGIPFGSVNLMYGVAEDESSVTATAGGGTLSLEFGVLSRLTGDPVYEGVARDAVRALWAHRSSLGLVGAHIDIFTGEWTQKDSGVGTSVDSFYEYLVKAYILFGDVEFLHIFRAAYSAVMEHLFRDPWYVEVNMDIGVVVWPLFNSLQAFWPGLQVLIGDVEAAARTHRAFYSVWRKYGFTPEGFNLVISAVQPGQQSYPLRPELAESTYWLYKATRDPFYLAVGRDMVTSLQLTRCPCGFCHVADVQTHRLSDHMESFFLAETVKYLFLLFDLAAGGHNIVDGGPYQYVFTTEGHLLPLTPEIALKGEKCSYRGAFCGSPKSTSCRLRPEGSTEGGEGKKKSEGRERMAWNEQDEERLDGDGSVKDIVGGGDEGEVEGKVGAEESGSRCRRGEKRIENEGGVEVESEVSDATGMCDAGSLWQKLLGGPDIQSQCSEGDVGGCDDVEKREKTATLNFEDERGSGEKEGVLVGLDGGLGTADNEAVEEKPSEEEDVPFEILCPGLGFWRTLGVHGVPDLKSTSH